MHMNKSGPPIDTYEQAINVLNDLEGKLNDLHCEISLISKLMTSADPECLGEPEIIGLQNRLEDWTNRTDDVFTQAGNWEWYVDGNNKKPDKATAMRAGGKELVS